MLVQIKGSFLQCLFRMIFPKNPFVLFHTQVDKMNLNYQWPEKKKTIARFFSIVKVVLHMYTETVSYFVAPYHVTVQPVFKHLVQKCRLDVASILKGESLAFLCLRNKYILLDVNCFEVDKALENYLLSNQQNDLVFVNVFRLVQK